VGRAQLKHHLVLVTEVDTLGQLARNFWSMSEPLLQKHRSVYTGATVPHLVAAVEAARPSLPAPDRRAREPADHRDENVVAPTSDRRMSRVFGNPRTSLRPARTTG
jgi:hypothetical protein